MRALFEAVRNRNPKGKNLMATVIAGSASGEKMFLSGGKVLWEKKDGEFLASQKETLKCSGQNEIIDIEGNRIFCEWIGSGKKLVICGGGHVSIPIIKMGRMLDFHVTVLEDRPTFADHARKAGADSVICEPFETGVEKICGDEDTCFVIVTRGHRYDQVCLELILKKEHGYIGMMGSKRRVAIVKQTLEEQGSDKYLLETVHTPIGLSIGAQTPAEIAVSILAEIIEVKSKTKRSQTYSEGLLDEILREERKELKKVLATIVSRKGSAPRETGTKMLIWEDGKLYESIGGGCAESDIIQKALLLMRSGEEGPKLCIVDMTGKEAEEEGMVCGGTIEVLLEIV